ncbi:TOBE domain-containing protein [Labrys okinawensis]|uniref:TOBE domain-containing protein n=1 Tax=Labrys okinawensis TaxID=346911 RepID=UPI0039BD2BD2
MSIVVMNRGRIEQIASPAVLYDAPTTRFVAGFIGTMNMLACRLVGHHFDAIIAAAGPLTFEAAAGDNSSGDNLIVGIRPEDVLIEPDGVPGRVIGTAFHGRTLRLHVELLDGTPLTIDAPRSDLGADYASGQTIHLRVRPGVARILRPN